MSQLLQCFQSPDCGWADRFWGVMDVLGPGVIEVGVLGLIMTGILRVHANRQWREVLHVVLARLLMALDALALDLSPPGNSRPTSRRLRIGELCVETVFAWTFRQPDEPAMLSALAAYLPRHRSRLLQQAKACEEELRSLMSGGASHLSPEGVSLILDLQGAVSRFSRILEAEAPPEDLARTGLRVTKGVRRLQEWVMGQKSVRVYEDV